MRFARIGDRTSLNRIAAHSPLRLFSPRRAGDCAWVVSSTLGGGLLAGDQIRLDVEVAPNCSAVLGTQAVTKIYRSIDERASMQELHGHLDDDALLIVAPDPVACFAGAVYEQRQRFDLSPSSALVVVDWITSGRWARGERWEMSRCRLRTDVFVAGQQVLRDAVRLDGDIAARMGRFNCWASVVLIGRRLAGVIEKTLKSIAGDAVEAGADPIFSAGPIPGGALVRVAGGSAEMVLQFLRRRLPFLAALAGEDPWNRKG
ncbi:MAG TPA: urease accessory protein UreD [Tepidisphaeraceae bacterium]|nr:urease accessory protein UreD [Tepidisphaeraceae bacterium]